MRFIFKVLILSLNSEFLSSYISEAFLEEGEDKDNYIEWYKEVNVFEDKCDLEIDTIIDVINADYDGLLPSVDGIIYFLNPLIQEEVEFFEMIVPVIKSVKQNIPIILIYNNGTSLLSSSANKLMKNLWIQYPDLECYTNLSPSQFIQALQCLCSSMISGDTPLYIENAHMRFPIFIQLANTYFKVAENEQKPEYYYYAAHAIKKAALIADKLKNKKLKKEVKKNKKVLKTNPFFRKIIRKQKKKKHKNKRRIKKERKKIIKKLREIQN